MISTFLKAKHWHLFLLTFVLPLLFQFFLMASMFSSVFVSVVREQSPDPFFGLHYLKFFPLMIIVVSGVHYGWFYAVAVGLQERIPMAIKMNVKRFKAIFSFAMLYLLAFCLFLGLAVPEFFLNIETSEFHERDFTVVAVSMTIIIPLHFITMGCIFYSMYFVAKTFKTAELQREAMFSDFLAEFFMIWFFPVGVWILQPRINQMAEAPNRSDNQ